MRIWKIAVVMVIGGIILWFLAMANVSLTQQANHAAYKDRLSRAQTPDHLYRVYQHGVGNEDGAWALVMFTMMIVVGGVGILIFVPRQKACPACGESIRKTATVCRHCHSQQP